MNKLLSPAFQNRQGFTIVESIISLMIAAMVILICGLVIGYGLNQRQRENNLTAFHMYLRMIESDEYSFKYLDHGNSNLRLTTADKKYTISLADNSLKMTTDHGGYIPIIDGVSDVEWRYHKSILVSTLIMQNGDVFTAKSFVRVG